MRPGTDFGGCKIETGTGYGARTIVSGTGDGSYGVPSLERSTLSKGVEETSKGLIQFLKQNRRFFLPESSRARSFYQFDLDLTSKNVLPSRITRSGCQEEEFSLKLSESVLSCIEDAVLRREGLETTPRQWKRVEKLNIPNPIEENGQIIESIFSDLDSDLEMSEDSEEEVVIPRDDQKGSTPLILLEQNNATKEMLEIPPSTEGRMSFLKHSEDSYGECYPDTLNTMRMEGDVEDEFFIMRGRKVSKSIQLKQSKRSLQKAANDWDRISKKCRE